MESPHKRLKPSPPTDEQDFVPLGGDDENEEDAEDEKYGYGNENEEDAEDEKYGYGNEKEHEQETAQNQAPRVHKARYKDYRGQPWYDRKHAQDRPKSKHTLPGHEPWVLVKTKLGRRFVHNTQTRESFWRIPDQIYKAVREFEQFERSQKEKEQNAQWAEEELKKMREKSQAEKVNRNADAEEQGRARRRRSESLQREDEEAMMAELAAEAEDAEEQDAKDVVKTLEPLAGDVGYDSEGSYEYVEVTDSEGEGDDEGAQPAETSGEAQPAELQEEEGPVEFGEDDIAYQLAAMGQDYRLDPGEYGNADQSYDDNMQGEEGAWDEDMDGLPLSDADAANLFRDLLDDHRISPFTPWDRLIADDSASSILHDNRYTVPPNMKARKDVWTAWARDTAARVQAERALMEKKDPRIPYLAFLAEKATPKLYWPEFKRKFKREPEMLERKLAEKDREKLYREHIQRLKLPESARKADLLALLQSVSLRELNHETPVDAVPQAVLSHLHFISLPAAVRDSVVRQHIASLPTAPESDGDEGDDEQRADQNKKRVERKRREEALEERRRKVEEEKRRAEKEERFARRGLREEEMELQRAMQVGDQGLRAHLRE